MAASSGSRGGSLKFQRSFVSQNVQWEFGSRVSLPCVSLMAVPEPITVGGRGGIFWPVSLGEGVVNFSFCPSFTD